jgi:hypothetical protein
VDWTIVVTTAITGAVGIAGVVGGVITSSRSARRNISAEADRARLADKRRIYALGLGALDTAMLADGAARAAEKHADSVEASGAATAVVEDQRNRATEHRAKAIEALRSANQAVDELQLIAVRPAEKLAKDALDSVSDPGVYAGHRNDLLKALRDDLGEEARRAYK